MTRRPGHGQPRKRRPGIPALLLVAIVSTSGSRLAAADSCTACPCNLVIADEIISADQTIESCDSIFVGPGVEVLSPARLILRAGERVELMELAVGDGADLEIHFDELLAPPRFTLLPSLTMAPNASAPLAGLVEVTTSIPTRIRLDFSGDGDTWSAEFDALATDHALPALGFHPGNLYEVVVTATAANGLKVMSSPLPAEAPPLPANFPSFTVSSNPLLMEPGVTLLPIRTQQAGVDTFLTIVDSVGRVIWFYRSAAAVTDARRLANGNFLLMLGGRTQFIEVDLLGNVLSTWHAAARSTPPAGAIGVDTDSFHHEVLETATGTLVVLSSEVRAFPNYPTSETDPTPQPEPANLVGDVVVELQRDGTIVGQWSLLDILDPYRVAYDSFTPFWAGFYTEVDTPLDWAHANAVIHDPSDDTFIVSARHQDSVFKFDRTGDLKWILGPHDNWLPPYSTALLTPIGSPFQFQYHQHAPQLTPSGGLLVFDNANYQASPPDPKDDTTNSRAVDFAIDEENLEVTQLWEHGGGGEIGFCPVFGDADPMPTTGNVLTVCGALASPAEGEPSARIVETTHSAPATVVFELLLTDDNPSGPANRTVYRAARLPALYP